MFGFKNCRNWSSYRALLGQRSGKVMKERTSRQSFISSDLEKILSKVRIGIVGLGGSAVPFDPLPFGQAPKHQPDSGGLRTSEELGAVRRMH